MMGIHLEASPEEKPNDIMSWLDWDHFSLALARNVEYRWRDQRPVCLVPNYIQYIYLGPKHVFNLNYHENISLWKAVILIEHKTVTIHMHYDAEHLH